MSYSISILMLCEIAQLSVKHMQKPIVVYFFYLNIISSHTKSILLYTQLKDKIENMYMKRILLDLAANS